MTAAIPRPIDASDARSPRLTFVATAAAAPPMRPGDRVVVLDTAWTPTATDRADVICLRPAFAAAVEPRNLFLQALETLDAWAAATGLAERLDVEGVTYWFRMREPLWHWLHERLLWRYALAAIDPERATASVSAPASESALVDVVRALGFELDVVGEPGAAATAPAPAVPKAPVRAGRASAAITQARSLARSVLRRLRPGGRVAGPPSERQRQDGALSERVARMLARDGRRVAVLTMPSNHQRVGDGAAGARRDPNLGSVIDRLIGAGLEPVVIGMGLDRRRPEDRAIVDADDRMLPIDYLATRWGDPGDQARADAAIGLVMERLEGVDRVPLDADGIDLAPALVAVLRTLVERIVRVDTHQRVRAERMAAELDLRAFVLTQEGHRTGWLVAGANVGAPTFALQHGVLYPTHPGYPDRRHPRLVVPSCTFVYGDYERRVLLAGAYRPDEVVASGSPRLDGTTWADPATGSGPDEGSPAAQDADRAAVRRELGVADGDQVLVVSTLHLPFVRRSHLLHMIERLLGGPLSGIHVVFKLHPGEQDDGPYRALLTGIAAAGGYAPPPISVIKDIDLYRLLRAADAHLGLHSTVLTDAVIAGTCNLIAMVEGSRDLLGYVPAGVASPVHDLEGLRAAMLDPRPPSAAARQAFIADHFTSAAADGDASARIAAAVVAAVAGSRGRAGARVAEGGR